MKTPVNVYNPKAKHDYFILDTIECGMVLRGNEVKTLRENMASIRDAWASIENGEIFLIGMHITPWRTANSFDVQEKRKIKLLAHKNEILKLQQKVMQEGITLVPIRVYLNSRSKVKVELGICKGKHTYDKRESLKKKDQQREIERHLK